ncbi:MAG: hypothetical protein IPJ19_03810 [Planctomycetes bacterium]|nr:hypothetical protein [Planctomycetota bacterium]
MIACPCGNVPVPTTGRGCNNSLNTGGASLTATGINSLSSDSVQLNCTGIGTATASCSGSNTSVLSVLYEGSTPIVTGIPWGDGVLCCNGPFYVLNFQAAQAGVYHFPLPGTTGLSQSAISQGDPLSAGMTRWYFVAYRDSCPSFCPSSVRAKSNSYEITWTP